MRVEHERSFQKIELADSIRRIRSIIILKFLESVVNRKIWGILRKEVQNMADIKETLKKKGLSQRWLVLKLTECGIKTTPQQLSEMLAGMHDGSPKANLILEKSQEILSKA